MGGGASRLDETLWEEETKHLTKGLTDDSNLSKKSTAVADGGLDPTRTDQTLDGCQPTTSYRFLEIRKKGGAHNQRDFEVVDVSTSEVLYTTCSVPGTLCWFDVLGPASCGNFRDLKLRVGPSGPAKKNWTVYRYDNPVFEGQLEASRELTHQSLHGGNEDENSESNNGKRSIDSNTNVNTNSSIDSSESETEIESCHKLYKTAAVTVSWSRYVAIMARYGPPKMEDYLDDDDQDDNDYGNFSNSHTGAKLDGPCMEDSAAAKFSPNSSNEYNPEKNTTEIKENTDIISATTEPDDDNTLITPSNGNSIEKITPITTKRSENTRTLEEMKTKTEKEKRRQTTMRLREHFGDLPPSTRMATWKNNGNEEDASSNKTIDEKMNHDFENEQNNNVPVLPRLTLQQKSKYDLDREGVLVLDDIDDEYSPPMIVQCQEIHNKMIGNHQTFRMTREELIEKLSLDQKQDLKNPTSKEEQNTNPSCGDGGSNGSENENCKRRNSSSWFSRFRRPSSKILSHEVLAMGDEIKKSEQVEAKDNNSESFQPETLESTMANLPGEGTDCAAVAKTTGSLKNNNDEDQLVLSSQGDRENKTLTSYFFWKNAAFNLGQHKMQMHLAKNSDLALQVVFSIIVNQVRSERNHTVFLATGLHPAWVFIDPRNPIAVFT